jgi:hypothetical protein
LRTSRNGTTVAAPAPPPDAAATDVVLPRRDTDAQLHDAQALRAPDGRHARAKRTTIRAAATSATTVTATS